jgi:hypothetical protein
MIEIANEIITVASSRLFILLYYSSVIIVTTGTSGQTWHPSAISGFCRELKENCALLGY